jgi:hypothetical protein
MSTQLVGETWKPRCESKVRDLPVALRYRDDECQRKRNHRGRCVGKHLVWDREALKYVRARLTRMENSK